MEHEDHHKHNKKSDHLGHSKKHEDQSNHHAHMAQNFLKRFWNSITLSAPIIALSLMIQEFLELRDSLSFSGDVYVSAFLPSILLFSFGIILNPAIGAGLMSINTVVVHLNVRLLKIDL